LLTEGREEAFDTSVFTAWTISEGVSFAVQNNALEAQL